MVNRCSKFKAQDLQARIKIERKTRVTDGQGGYTTTWNEIGAPWAKWRPLSGNEQFLAMRVHSDVSVRAVIRYRSDEFGRPFYSTGDRVTYLDRRYDIKSMLDVDNARMWLEISLSSLPDGYPYSENLEGIVAPPTIVGDWNLEDGGTWDLEDGGTWELQ